MSKSIIIDCDPGIDDSVAILYTLAQADLKVLALHTVAGNVNCNQTSLNARKVLTLAGHSDIPVCQGSNVPLVCQPVYAADVHGQDGMSGYDFGVQDLPELSHLTAMQSYVKLLESATEPLTIVAVGPLTNVALLIRAYPHLCEKIEQVVIMGGGLKGGNITMYGEFNFYVDPHAAQIVLNSGLKVVMAGLDVTEKARISEEDYEWVQERQARIGHFCLGISQKSFATADAIGYGRTTAPNDVVAIMYLVHPEVFEVELAHVQVSTTLDQSRGLTFRDQRYLGTDPANCQVILDVDQALFSQYLRESLVTL